MDVLEYPALDRFEDALWLYQGRDLNEDDLEALRPAVPVPPPTGFFERIWHFFSPPKASLEATENFLHQRNVRVIAEHMASIPGVSRGAARWLITTAPQLLNGVDLRRHVWRRGDAEELSQFEPLLKRIATLYAFIQPDCWLRQALRASSRLRHLMHVVKADAAPHTWQIDELLQRSGVSIRDLDEISELNRLYQYRKETGQFPISASERTRVTIEHWLDRELTSNPTTLVRFQREAERNPFLVFEEILVPIIACLTGNDPYYFDEDVEEIKSAFQEQPAVRDFILSFNRGLISVMRSLPDIFYLVQSEDSVETFFNGVRDFFITAHDRQTVESHIIFGDFIQSLRLYIWEVRAEMEEGNLEPGSTPIEVLQHYVPSIPSPLLSKFFLSDIPVISKTVTSGLVRMLLKQVFGEEMWKSLSAIHDPLVAIIQPFAVALLTLHPLREFLPSLEALAGAIDPSHAEPPEEVVDTALMDLLRTFGRQLTRRRGDNWLAALRFLAARLSTE